MLSGRIAIGRCWANHRNGGGLLRAGPRFLIVLASKLELEGGSIQGQASCHRPSLLNLYPGARGKVLEAATRQILGDMCSSAATKDPAPGLCVNGMRRSRHSAEYDWLMDGKRFECKSAVLRWDKYACSWCVNFYGIKAACESVRAHSAFDELILSICTPRALYIYLHDRTFCLSKDGVRTATRGNVIRIRGPRKEADWQSSLDGILGKLDDSSNGCRRVAEVPLTDERITNAFKQSSYVSQVAYIGVPLSGLSPYARGLHIEKMVKAVDAVRHPEAVFQNAARSLGKNRGFPVQYDWMRDGLRVECKSSGLNWNVAQKRWLVTFDNIKPACFDELLLAIWSHSGIFIYKHDLKFGVRRNGVRTEVAGYRIQYGGPRSEHTCLLALRYILQKLEDAGCTLVARIVWQ